MTLPDPINKLKSSTDAAFNVISWRCTRCGARQGHNAGCKWVLVNGRKTRICAKCAAERKDAPRIRKESPPKIEPWFCASCKTKQTVKAHYVIRAGKKVKLCPDCAPAEDARGI